MTESFGALKDLKDDRDLLYTDVMGVPEFDWEKGFSVTEELGIEHITQDQGSSLSCTGQAMAAYTRFVLASLGAPPDFLSAKWIYGAIALPSGGAYLREAIKRVANIGPNKEIYVPSYENGDPPNEWFMRDLDETPELLEAAKKLDRFSYRMVPGDTASIDLMALAIKDGFGALGGFTCSNTGFCRPDCVPPEQGEKKYGHALALTGAGLLDIDLPTIPKGTKCVFTPNSWGGRYEIKEGRWAGLQAIPENYFLAGEETAVGFVRGINVFNSWVLIPDEILKPSQKLMDILKVNEGKLVMDSEQTGAIGWVKDGKVLQASPDRVAEMVANYLVEQEGVGLPASVWNEARESGLIKDF